MRPVTPPKGEDAGRAKSSTTIQTKDDKRHTGVINAEDDAMVVLRTKDNRLRVIQKKDIKSRQTVDGSKKSVAPSVPQNLTAAIGHRVRFKMRSGTIVEGKLTLFNGLQAKVETVEGAKYVRMVEVDEHEILAEPADPRTTVAAPDKTPSPSSADTAPTKSSSDATNIPHAPETGLTPAAESPQ